MEVLLELILILVGQAVLVALKSIIDGYVMKILWSWFVVPVFHLPLLSVAQAIGISIVIDVFTYRSSSSKKDKSKEDTKKDKSKEDTKKVIYPESAKIFLFPFIALGIGWIVHQFV
jgi:phosphate/sulfate permease